MTLRFAPPPRPDIAAAGLFLDFDGTLVALAERPDGVVVDKALVALLVRLGERLGGRVAIVSGRSLEQLDGMIGAEARGLALVGSHGIEIRRAGQRCGTIGPARSVRAGGDGTRPCVRRAGGGADRGEDAGRGGALSLAPRGGAAGARAGRTAGGRAWVGGAEGQDDGGIARGGARQGPAASPP